MQSGIEEREIAGCLKDGYRQVLENSSVTKLLNVWNHNKT
jgi:hypothetical protein